MTTRKFWWLFISSLVIVAGAAWFYQYIDWVEKEIDLGPTAEAKKEPFLAAKRYFESLDIEVELRGNFRQLDKGYDDEGLGELSYQDVIILVDAYGSLSPKRANHLLDWVGRGGQLIVSASNPFIDNVLSINDPLFEQFNITLEESDGSSRDAESIEQLSSFGNMVGLKQLDACNLLTPQVEFTFADDTEIVQADFLSTIRLIVDDFESSKGVIGDDGGFILQYDHGDGLISYMSHLDFWKNTTIGCLDHAYILWQLASTNGKVWFLYNRDAPSLISLLWQHYHYFVTALFLLIMSWLWRRNNRFGPIRLASDTSSRRLMEHIDASARFNWKHNHGRQLINVLRDDIKRRIEKYHPGYTKKPVKNQTVILAKQVQLDLGQIEKAMLAGLNSSPENFAEIVVLLKNIKERL
jgi:uncharacterized protein DUF4350